MKYKIESPAKINLHLEVLNKKKNGYHNIHSIFQTISFSDTMVFELTDNQKCEIKGFDFPLKDNIIYKSWYLYCKIVGKKIGLKVNVKKRIPEGAGLGGGSSNAASTIRFLDMVLKSPIEKVKLYELATEIGADVPFFLESNLAIVSGIGEEIKPININLKDISIIVINPGFRTNTANAFFELDKFRDNLKDPLSSKYSNDFLINNLNKIPKQWPFFNSFYSLYRQSSSEFLEIGKILDDLNVDFWTMSGSGSSFIALFSSNYEAKANLSKIKLKFPNSYLAFPLDFVTPFIVL